MIPSLELRALRYGGFPYRSFRVFRWAKGWFPDWPGRDWQGTLNVAGTDRLSRHANGTAIDLNPGLPMSPGIVDCFEQSGFEWGGRWSNPDPMHFELKEIK